MAVAALIAVAAGQAIQAIAQANQLRAQADIAEEEGRQELLLAKRQVRREFGQSAVEAGAAGVQLASFQPVFTSQAIEDAEFLGRIQQATEIEVESLRRSARATLLTGLVQAGATAIGGAAAIRTERAQLKAAKEQRRSILMAHPGGRLFPGGNIFGAGRGTGVNRTGFQGGFLDRAL